MPLPTGHRFPQSKYRLLREAVEAAGLGEVWHAGPVPWARLEAVHDPAYLRTLREGTLDRRAERVLGLPWSRELVERARRSVQATVQAAGDALDAGLGMNLGGGTHHAGRAAARGYCVLNDVPVTIAGLRAAGRAQRFLVVDCDVHQGDGTAELLAGDPDAYTLSVHGGANYPFKRATSDLDVDLRTGTGDDEYLEALGGALATAFAAARPELVFYLAGADPWEGDRLGPPGADEGGPGRARRARARRGRGCGRAGVRLPRRRVRTGHPRHRRDQPRDGTPGGEQRDP